MFKNAFKFGGNKNQNDGQAYQSGGGGAGAWGGGAFGNNVNVQYENDPQPGPPAGQSLWGTAPAMSPAMQQAAWQGGMAIMNNPMARQVAMDAAMSQVRRPDIEAPPSRGGMGPPPPGYGAGMPGASMTQREADLVRREAELRERERAMGGGNGFEKKRNWPSCCPIMYHDIAEEVQDGFKGAVRWGYFSFLFFCAFLLWQFICVTALLIKNQGSGPGAFFLAAIYLLIGMPGALFLWYKRLYNLGKTGSGYVLFLVFYFIHLCFCIWCAVAPPISSSGAVNGAACSGWLSTIDAFKTSKIIGVMYVAGACAWTFESILCFVIFGMVYKSFRGRQ